jgi:hypothetical protein
MKDVIYLLFALLATLAKLLRPGGRSIAAEYFNCQWQLEIGIRQGQLDQTPQAVIGINVISTRRLRARPCAVSLGATG